VEPSSTEPVVEPSWAEPLAGPSRDEHEDIDDTVMSLSSLSLTSDPSVFSPLSFTFSSTKEQVFHFQSPQEEASREFPQESENEESSLLEEEASGDDSDPDEESDAQSEEAPEFIVTVSGHVSYVFGCQPIDLVAIPDKIRAEILMMFQIFLPKGARCCKSHKNDQSLRPPQTTDETMTSAQYVEAFHSSSSKDRNC